MGHQLPRTPPQDSAGSDTSSNTSLQRQVSKAPGIMRRRSAPKLPAQSPTMLNKDLTVSECAVENSDEDSSWEDDEDDEADDTPMGETHTFERLDQQSRLTSPVSLLTKTVRGAESIPINSQPKSPRANRQQMLNAELPYDVRQYIIKERNSKKLPASKSNHVSDKNWSYHDDWIQGW